MINHTPLPWIITENGANGHITMEGANGTVVHFEDVGSIPDEMRDKEALRNEVINNAFFIKCACNSHYDLCKALEEALKWIPVTMQVNAKAALKKARGE